MPLTTVAGGELVSTRYFRDGEPFAVGLARGPQQYDSRVVTERELVIPVDVEQTLKRVSQLGLKELWLAETPAGHNRWDHSVGVLNAGMLWLHGLRDSGTVPEHTLQWATARGQEPATDGWNSAIRLCGYALLLHDYGHVPFSHLLQEVLASVNWLPLDAAHSGVESAVLRRRLPALVASWDHLATSIPHLEQENAATAVEWLIAGRGPIPWLQAVVNSPVDADKIDYLEYDSSLLAATNYPLRTRVQHTNKPQWIEEFLYDQWVNHAGLLCLDGRSARAAADLWRDRVFLYDRFYLAPEMRVPEAMASEIIRQFMIRAVMNADFRKRVASGGFLMTETIADSALGGGSTTPQDEKFERVLEILASLLERVPTDRTLEFSLLERMSHALAATPEIDPGYRELLARCYGALAALKERKQTLREVVANCLVGEPIIVLGDPFDDLRERLRPIQHAYSRHAIVDLVRLPPPLAGGPRWRIRQSGARGLDYQILVPDGAPSSWGPGKRACVPLTDATVHELDRRYCRIVVVAPDAATTPTAEFVWDRVRACVIEAGYNIAAMTPRGDHE